MRTRLLHRWAMAEMVGYEPRTTFWDDFCIADAFGKSAVKDTYRRAFAEWKTNYIYLTELVMVLNHKIWQWYEQNEEMAQLYNDLWMKADNYAMNHLKGEELNYYLITLD